MTKRIIDANKEIDFLAEDKKVKIVINEIEYEIKSSFKIKTYDRCSEIIEKEQNYKKAFEEIKKEIFEKEINENKITIKELEKFKASDDEKIICILLKNKQEKQIYESMKDDNIYKKYFDVMEIHRKEIFKNLQEPILNFSRQISDFVRIISSSMENIIKNTLNQFASLIEATLEENKYNFKKFADYGWTPWDDMPIDLFFREVNSKEEADKLCLELIDEGILEEILKKVNDTSAKNNYIDESIVLFEEGHFRSCAMLIIAYIDRVISENIVIKDKSKYSKKIGKERDKQN